MMFNIYMIKLIKTFITFLFWFIIFLVFTIICLPFSFLPPKIRYQKNNPFFFLSFIWNKLLYLVSFIKIKIIDRQNLPTLKTPSIIVANHASALDVFLLETVIGNQPHIWLSKDSYSKIPLFGTLMKRMHVVVKRENPKLAAKAIVKAMQLVKLGPKHIVMFPEGTRFDDGKIHPFMPGFTIFAKKLNMPIVPILITGTNKIFPKKNLLIDSTATEVKLVIGKPIYYEHEYSEKEFSKKVHNWFTKTLVNLNDG